MVNQLNPKAEVLKFGDAYHGEFPPGHNLDSFQAVVDAWFEECAQLPSASTVAEAYCIARRILFCLSSTVFAI